MTSHEQYLPHICLFAGTTEGRALAELLSGQPVRLTVCTATEYGGHLLNKLSENIEIHSERMNKEEIAAFLNARPFDLVIDATHPYAAVVTENISAACRMADTKYLRLNRDPSGTDHHRSIFQDIPSLVQFLNQRKGNILLTTGSKELAAFTGLNDFRERVYARVLPMKASLDACAEAGLPPAHIIAMQGPFSVEMNNAVLRMTRASWLVTKDSGDTGGFEAKAIAAEQCGAELLVIGQPAQPSGMDFREVVQYLRESFDLNLTPIVDLIGIGPGSKDQMTEAVLHAVTKADCVIGASRMIEAVALPGQQTFEAVVPERIAEYILQHPEFRRIAVVFSGDISFFSGCKKLIPLLAECEVNVHPGISSLSYLCAKLRTSAEDIVPVSMHGRNSDLLSALKKHKRLFVLTGGENTVNSILTTILQAGYEDIKVSVGENLSYPEEKVTVGTSGNLSGQQFAPLSVMLLEHENVSDRIVTHGIADELFIRSKGEKGIIPMTKREIRSVSLSLLGLREDSVCWDVGAGTGSVSIEMALQARIGKVYAIEQDPEALELLNENEGKFGLSNLVPVPGSAPDVCGDLPTPTHVFIGGTSGKMDAILSELIGRNSDIRLVSTAVTLESVAEFTKLFSNIPGSDFEVTMIQSAKSRKAGPYHLMNGGNPVYIFSVTLKKAEQ